MKSKTTGNLNQLSLFADQEPQPTSIEVPGQATGRQEIDPVLWQRCQKNPLHLNEKDIDAMRVWLQAWGKRNGYPCFSFPFSGQGVEAKSRLWQKEHSIDPTIDRRVGLVWDGEQAWTRDLGRIHGTEWYPGEWLVKCIEHVQRFDAGLIEIPDQFRASKRQHKRTEEEE